MHICIRAKYTLFIARFLRIFKFSIDFRENSNIEFHEIPSSESRIALCGRTSRYDELVVAFCSFPTITKNMNAVGNVMFCYSRKKFI